MNHCIGIALTYRVEEFCEFGEVIPPASMYHLDVDNNFVFVVRLWMTRENFILAYCYVRHEKRKLNAEKK